MIEGRPIQSKEFAFPLGFNRSSSRSIVHQGKFSKEFSRVVGLEIGLGSRKDFVAIKLSRIDNVESISLFSLDNHVLGSRSMNFLHRINNDVQVFLVKVAEEDTLFNEFLDFLLDLRSFGNDFRDKLGLLVKLPEDFSTNSLSTIFFLQLLFLFLLQFAEELGLGLF